MLAILTTHPIQYQVPLWKALARDGRVPFEVWYLTDRHTRASHDEEFGKTFAWDLEMLEGYPYRFIDAAPGASPASFWQCRITEDLASRLKQAGAKALWIQGWQVAAYWQAAFLAERARVALWLRAESNELKRVPRWKQLAKRWLLGQYFRRVDHFLCIGSANRRLYEKYAAPAGKLHLTPYAVDNERFALQAGELRPRRADLRRDWGIHEDAFCVLFCGKFIPKKHPEDLIAAARAIHDRGRIPRIHLLFVGSGELGGELRKQCAVVFDAEAPVTRIDSDQWSPPASFAGFINQKDISKAYVAADCMVLPSDFGETWGLVVNEAMASGLPCATSDACGCAEDLVRPDWPERVFKVGDHAGMASSIAHIYLGDRTGEAERRRVSTHAIGVTLNEVARLYGR